MTSFRDIATDALKYWEPRRLIYNGVLAAITVGGFVLLMPRSLETWEWPMVLLLLFLAAVANLLYCAAYIVDVFVQLSSFRDTWRRRRWALFAFGLLFAAGVAVPIVQVLFASPFSH